MSASQPFRSTAPFRSILYEPGSAAPSPWPADLPLYRDLNVDQIVDAVIAGREQYELREFFYAPLDDEAEIAYRHDVFRDLDGSDDPDGTDAPDVSGLRAHVEEFANGMQAMRRYLARTEKHGYEYQHKRWFLSAASTYCAAVRGLAERLGEARLRSAGLAGLRDHLTAYTRAAEFVRLDEEATAVEDALAALTYCVELRGDRVRVEYFHDELDYSDEVAAVFEKFRQGAVRSYLSKFPSYDDLDHVEAQILERVGCCSVTSSACSTGSAPSMPSSPTRSCWPSTARCSSTSATWTTCGRCAQPAWR